MSIVNKLIKDIEQRVPDGILFGSPLCAYIYHQGEEISKKIGDDYKPHFGELLEEPFCLNFFHPWDYISFFSELRNRDIFEINFKKKLEENT